MPLWPSIGWYAAALLTSAAVHAAPAKTPGPRPAQPSPAARAAAAPPADLAPGQLEAASRVLTGAMSCEFSQTVQLRPIDGQRGHFRLVFKKTSYTLVPQETTTGAVRLEDRKAGVVWLQIATKSMLLNAKTGNRMVDNCLHDEQRHAVAPAGSALGIEAPLVGTDGDPGPPVVASAQLPTDALIPRQVLFGDPPMAGGSVSPDGQWLAWLAPREGVVNVWVAPVTAPERSRALTDERQRGIGSFRFARDGRHLLYAQDESGDENFQIHAVDLAGGAARALSPRGSHAAIAGLSDAYAGEVLLSVNDRDPRRFDLVRVDLASGKSTRVPDNEGSADTVPATGRLVHPVSGLLQAQASNDLSRRWLVIDPAIAPDLQRLEALAAGGEYSVAARSRDDRTWVVTVRTHDGSGQTHVYDRASGQARLWYDSRPALAGPPPAPTRRLAIGARDGVVMSATLTLPTGCDADGDGRPEQALPMVLLVQDSSSAGEYEGFNATPQWLANRGYAVLGVDFRAATGAGGTVADAGDGGAGRQWHEDLLDAVDWAAVNGVARRDKVALMGGSDGRHAAWVGLATTPKVYACGVVGGSRVANPRTPQTRRGPIVRLPPSDVERIERPLLIGQGARDPRVEQADSARIVAALQARQIPVSYLLYPDEGHGFARPANRISFHAVVEQFLASCLGGRAQAVGDDFRDSSIQVRAGVEPVPAVQAGVPPPLGR